MSGITFLSIVVYAISMLVAYHTARLDYDKYQNKEKYKNDKKLLYFLLFISFIGGSFLIVFNATEEDKEKVDEKEYIAGMTNGGDSYIEFHLKDVLGDIKLIVGHKGLYPVKEIRLRIYQDNPFKPYNTPLGDVLPNHEPLRLNIGKRERYLLEDGSISVTIKVTTNNGEWRQHMTFSEKEGLKQWFQIDGAIVPISENISPITGKKVQTD